MLQLKKCLILPVKDRFKTLEIINLENLNLVELNAQEMNETEGGFLLTLLFAAIFTIVAILVLE